MNKNDVTFIRENHSAEYDESEAWCERATALCDSGRYEEALQAYDKALELNPDDSMTWYNKGNVLFCYLDRRDEALQA